MRNDKTFLKRRANKIQRRKNDGQHRRKHVFSRRRSARAFSDYERLSRPDKEAPRIPVDA